jgi:hypothetical protein
MTIIATKFEASYRLEPVLLRRTKQRIGSRTSEKYLVTMYCLCCKNVDKVLMWICEVWSVLSWNMNYFTEISKTAWRRKRHFNSFLMRRDAGQRLTSICTLTLKYTAELHICCHGDSDRSSTLRRLNCRHTCQTNHRTINKSTGKRKYENDIRNIM